MIIGEGLRISDREPNDTTLIINGDHPLSGDYELPGAKNFALQAIAATVLTEDPVQLSNFPLISDTETNLGIIERMGAQIDRNGHQVTIHTKGLDPDEIDPRESTKTSASKYFIPTLTTRFGKIKSGPPGGDHIGATDRFKFTPEVFRLYEQLGISHRAIEGLSGDLEFEFYELPKDETPDGMRLDQRYFGPTIQALLRFAASDRSFTITNPNVEPEVGYTIGLLQNMGADIEYDENGFEEGKDRIHIRGVGELKGTGFPIFSDPNALVSYAVMSLITNGEVSITGIDHNPKVNAFINILQKLNADFSYDHSTLSLRPSIGRLTGVDLTTDFWPAQCHTDWQQILAPLLAVSRGQSRITENVYPERFTNVELLNFMGADISFVKDSASLTNPRFQNDGKSHSLIIRGNPGMTFSPTIGPAPKDVRGSTGILAAMLSAPGRSELTGAHHIFRGLEGADYVLSSLGADIWKT